MVDRDEIIYKLGKLEEKVDHVHTCQHNILTSVEKIKDKVSALEGFRVGIQISSAVIALIISAAASLFTK